MSYPALQLGNPANWEQLYSERFDAVVSSDGRNFASIPEITVPILIEYHILGIGCSSQSAKPSWNLGGWVTPFARGIPGELLELEMKSYRLSLNTSKLIFLPKVTSNYSLKFKPAKWHKDVTLFVWQYTGAQTDISDELLIQLTAKVDELQATIDAGVPIADVEPAVVAVLENIGVIGGSEV